MSSGTLLEISAPWSDGEETQIKLSSDNELSHLGVLREKDRLELLLELIHQLSRISSLEMLFEQ